MTNRAKQMIRFFLQEIEEGYNEIRDAQTDAQEQQGHDRIIRAEYELLWEYEIKEGLAR